MLNIPKVGDKAAPKPDDYVPPADVKTLRLSSAIKSHAGEIRELKLREPIAADYIEIGKLPFNVRGDAADRRVEMDFKLMAQWASRLSGHDELVISQLKAEDWLELVGRVNALLIQAGIQDVGN